MNASFEEKSVWIVLVTIVILYSGYYFVAAQMWADGVDTLITYVPLFAIVVIALSTVLAIAHIVAAIVSRPQGRDERDKLINWRAESNSSWVLAIGVLAAIAHMVISTDNVLTAHILLMSLIASEIIKAVLQIAYYRKGF